MGEGGGGKFFIMFDLYSWTRSPAPKVPGNVYGNN